MGKEVDVLFVRAEYIPEITASKLSERSCMPTKTPTWIYGREASRLEAVVTDEVTP
jgi:hypothetical protein